MKKDSKIYIAGHEGLIGQNLVDALVKHGYKNLLLEKQTHLDLTNQKEVADYFSKAQPEYVILLAAKMGGIEEKIAYPTEFLYENLMIQNNVIWQAHRKGVKKLLFIGSASAYPLDTTQPIVENSLMTGALSPTEESYALAKIAGVKLCEKITTEHHKSFISCMPTNVYGPGYKIGEGSGNQVIPALIDRMHKAKFENSKSTEIWGSGNAKRDFIYVDDLVSALIMLMEKYDSHKPINITNAQAVTIRELALTIKKVVKFDGELHFDTSKPEGTPVRVLDSEKLKQLGFVCSINIEQGVQKTYNYFLKFLKSAHV